LTDSWPELDLVTAYEIQDETLRLRMDVGQTIAGVKLGLTSHAKQRAMGIDTPILGWLTSSMRLKTGRQPIDTKWIHPRLEPEIAFVMASPLSGPDVSLESAMEAVGEVRGAVEVIDSRFRDFRFTLPDVVADNASAGGFAIGTVACPPKAVDPVNERCCLLVDGEPVATAAGEAVLGHPGLALVLAANQLAARGRRIEAGWIVLTGGLVDAVPVRPGSSYLASFDTLGEVAFLA
jgi:2-oxo-3-hexenedioate decarboxylase